MPGQQLQTSGFILSRQASGSDRFEQLAFFSPTAGLLHALTRLAGRASPSPKRPASPAATPLDLFDEVELWLESSNQGRTWFVKEHRLIQRHDGIGRSYEALRAAAALGTLLVRNPVPDESREAVAALLRASFGALAGGGRPDVVWLKALYTLLRDEGYPAKQHWWPGLPAADRDTAAQLLNQPVAGQQAAAPDVARITRSLETWIRGETELHLPL